MNLTDDEIRVKCAEVMGWENVRHTTTLKGRVMTTGLFGNPPGWASGGYCKNELVPNYPASG